MTTATSPVLITLTDRDRAGLEALARARKAPLRSIQRAWIVLAAADGQHNAQIARDLGLHVDTVRTWRGRFAAQGLTGLTDRARSGRPPVFAATVRAEVKALACSLPTESGVPLSRWSSTDLAAEAVARGFTATLSASTVRRWLNADAIKPWQHRSWIFPRDPDFADKAARVLDLYDRHWQGRRLRPDEYVISADEKSQLQALHRRHEDLPPAPGRTRRVEFEYRRGGTLAYLAALDVHHATVMGRCAPSTGIVPFSDLVEQVMTQEPYASARRVFWIVDNGSSHNGQASVQRMHQARPKAVLVHLPIHASWLNQIEIFFSIVQRKVIKPANFTDLTALEQRLLAFEKRYNATAEPFDWRYTQADLNAHLDRLATHEQLNAA
ncbi:MAG: IS630 family transposase [Pseudonocardiales bacterium]|nr:MAG: IS630 family transposase [Pseudonocardiales bacterium]